MIQNSVGPKDRGQLVSLLTRPYAKANFKDPEEIKVVRDQDLVAEDRRIDQAYFTNEELYQISCPVEKSTDPIYAAEILPEDGNEPEFQLLAAHQDHCDSRPCWQW